MISVSSLVQATIVVYDEKKKATTTHIKDIAGSKDKQGQKRCTIIEKEKKKMSDVTVVKRLILSTGLSEISSYGHNGSSVYFTI